MPSQDKRHCSETDVLSNLPQNVIDEVLMYLPLRDAVRTSILSNKWRYNWCRLPHLKLDNTLWETSQDLVSPTIGFTNIIYHFLAHHVGPVTKFTFSIANLETYPNIDNLISFLSRNGIQQFVLKLPKYNSYILPYSLFTCSQMRDLRLQNCYFIPPPAFNGFDKLISLELDAYTISSEVLGSLIFCSPLLEKLVLRIAITLNQIQISAPNLRSFDFEGSMKSISLKKAPLLVKVSLVGTATVTERQQDIGTYFESFPALEHLHLNYSSVQFFTVGSGAIPAKLFSPLNCLKYLRLSEICLDEVALRFVLMKLLSFHMPFA